MNYELRRVPRARSVRLRVRHDGSIVVTAPRRVSQRFVEAFVAQNAGWIERARTLAQSRRALLPPDLADTSVTHYLRYKERARQVARQKVAQWNAQLGFRVTSIRVKRARTQWGSCSNNKILNFNYKLLFLDEPLQDYIVIHELAHLREMNHSAEFWALVASLCPNHEECRRRLKGMT